MSCEIKGILQAAEKILLDNTLAERKVFVQEPDDPWDEDLPAVFLWGLREPWVTRDGAPKSFERSLEVAVEAFITSDVEGESLAFKLYDLTMQVEACFLSDPFLRACPVEIDIDKTGGAGWEFGFDNRGKRRLGAGRLTWTYVYVTQTTQTRKEQLDRLETAGVDWDFAPPDATLEAQDDIDLPQT